MFTYFSPSSSRPSSSQSKTGDIHRRNTWSAHRKQPFVGAASPTMNQQTFSPVTQFWGSKNGAHLHHKEPVEQTTPTENCFLKGVSHHHVGVADGGGGNGTETFPTIHTSFSPFPTPPPPLLLPSATKPVSFALSSCCCFPRLLRHTVTSITPPPPPALPPPLAGELAAPPPLRAAGRDGGENAGR